MTLGKHAAAQLAASPLETAEQFGEGQRLVGVLHHPTPDRQPATLGVILLNASIEHRVGPKRLYTGLARWISACGLPVLRFDYGGLGESRKLAQLPSLDADPALVDTADAMDMMHARLGCERFILFGLCSGGDDAHRMAVADARVVGTILVDVYGYHTRSFWLRYYMDRVFSLRRWGNALRRWAPGLFPTNPDDDAHAATRAVADSFGFFDNPPRKAMAAQLAQLVARDVRQLHVFSGEVSELHNHAGQFRKAFPDVDLGTTHTEEYWPQADHTFSRTEDRIRLLRTIARWLDENYPDACNPAEADQADARQAAATT